MTNDGIQLELNFDSTRNRFKEWLDAGRFFILIEVDGPAPDQSVKAALRRASELEYAVYESDQDTAGLALSVPTGPNACGRLIDFAAGLWKDRRDKSLLSLSGRDVTLDRLVETALLAKNAGYPNLVPVSGDGIPGDRAAARGKRRIGFTESVHVLHHLQQLKEAEIFPGCVVNPFKYVETGSLAQYHKLIKKINFGANYAITQFGWDARKSQELRWYLDQRSLPLPTIARLTLLTPETLSEINDGKWPGVQIPPDLRAILEKESRFSRGQFESAQWRRLQLQIAGAYHLGYSGAQIAGLASPRRARVLFRHVREAMEEFKTFEDWRDEYVEHVGRIDLAPYPQRFLLYEDLLTKAHCEERPVFQPMNIPPLTRWESLRLRLLKKLFRDADQRVASEGYISKKMLVGCRGCRQCRLPGTHYLCPELCPKGLSNGPCGGAKLDGTCELRDEPCLHERRFRLAYWLNDLEPLERDYSPSGD